MAITVSIVEDNDQLRGTLARVINRAEGIHELIACDGLGWTHASGRDNN